MSRTNVRTRRRRSFDPYDEQKLADLLKIQSRLEKALKHLDYVSMRFDYDNVFDISDDLNAELADLQEKIDNKKQAQDRLRKRCKPVPEALRKMVVKIIEPVTNKLEEMVYEVKGKSLSVFEVEDGFELMRVIQRKGEIEFFEPEFSIHPVTTIEYAGPLTNLKKICTLLLKDKEQSE